MVDLNNAELIELPAFLGEYRLLVQQLQKEAVGMLATTKTESTVLGKVNQAIALSQEWLDRQVTQAIKNIPPA